MTADVIQLRDYQNKRDLDRLYELTTEELKASGIPQAWPDFSLAATYHAPDKDPA